MRARARAHLSTLCATVINARKCAHKPCVLFGVLLGGWAVLSARSLDETFRKIWLEERKNLFEITEQEEEAVKVLSVNNNIIIQSVYIYPGPS